MPNGEIICEGMSIGWFRDKKKYLSVKGEVRRCDRCGSEEEEGIYVCDGCTVRS